MLAGEFLEQHSTYSERVGTVMLGLLLPIGTGASSANGSKLPVAALKAIKRINHPLLEGEKKVAALPQARNECKLCCNAAWLMPNALAGDVSKINNC